MHGEEGVHQLSYCDHAFELAGREQWFLNGGWVPGNRMDYYGDGNQLVGRWGVEIGKREGGNDPQARVALDLNHDKDYEQRGVAALNGELSESMLLLYLEDRAVWS
jgi:hypothetical protein